MVRPLVHQDKGSFHTGCLARCNKRPKIEETRCNACCTDTRFTFPWSTRIRPATHRPRCGRTKGPSIKFGWVPGRGPTHRPKLRSLFFEGQGKLQFQRKSIFGQYEGGTIQVEGSLGSSPPAYDTAVWNKSAASAAPSNPHVRVTQ